MNFLCDSNAVSELMKPKPHEMVEEWFSHQEVIFMSVVSIEEIYYGLTYKDAYRKKVWFDNLVQFRCEVLSVTIDIAKQCGIWRGQFRQQGIVRSQADLLIGATALLHEFVLVTRNTGCGIQLFNPFDKPK